MCCSLYEENGIFKMSEGKVRRFIEIALNPNLRTDTEPVSMITVIGPPGNIEASLALCITQNWYTEDWHVEELWNFVRPDRRQSGNAKSLLEYAKQVQAQLGIPLMVGILSSDRTEAKVRLYSRQLGAPSGAYFVWPSWIELRDQKKQSAQFRALFLNKKKTAA